MILLYCFILTCIIVYVYDWVSFPRNFAAYVLSAIRGKEITLDRIKLPKLLQCSLCASQWGTLAILLLFNWKLVPFSFIFGWSTKHILTIFNIIDLGITKILNYVYGRIS